MAAYSHTHLLESASFHLSVHRSSRIAILVSSQPAHRLKHLEGSAVRVRLYLSIRHSPVPYHRFDIVLVLLDAKYPEWDTIVSCHILGEDWGTRSYRGKRLKKFIKLLSTSVNICYSECTRTSGRMMESLICLAEGHARLMFRNEVTYLDAIAAIFENPDHEILLGSNMKIRRLKEQSVYGLSYVPDSWRSWLNIGALKDQNMESHSNSI
ncbi:hypothetical protein NL676_010383 [Syzygium grande]|nr:hypothetical protein NL676_010383 [Syzygium grande]